MEGIGVVQTRLKKSHNIKELALVACHGRKKLICAAGEKTRGGITWCVISPQNSELTTGGYLISSKMNVGRWCGSSLWNGWPRCRGNLPNKRLSHRRRWRSSLPIERLRCHGKSPRCTRSNNCCIFAKGNSGDAKTWVVKSRWPNKKGKR